MPLNYQKVQTKKTRGRQILGLKPGKVYRTTNGARNKKSFKFYFQRKQFWIFARQSDTVLKGKKLSSVILPLRVNILSTYHFDCEVQTVLYCKRVTEDYVVACRNSKNVTHAQLKSISTF